MKDGEYKMVPVKTSLSPNLYGRIRTLMDRKGINTESSFLHQAVVNYIVMLEKEKM